VLVRIHAYCLELVDRGSRQLPKQNIILLEVSADGLDSLVGLGPDGIIGHDLEHQMRPTPQVQTKFYSVVHFGQAWREACKQVNGQYSHAENNQKACANSFVHNSYSSSGFCRADTALRDISILTLSATRICMRSPLKPTIVP